MKKKLRVGVIFGGRSGEHEVSLVSAASVIAALDRQKYDVVPIGITHEGKWISSDESLRLLMESLPLSNEPERFLSPEPHRKGLASVKDGEKGSVALDVVFPLVHGTCGEDGTLQGLLELSDLPYVGAGVAGSSLGMDKILQKKLFEQADLPVARYCWFLSNVCRTDMKRVVNAVESELKYPLFVKPANTGSSVGIAKAHNREELVEAIGDAARYDRKVLVEQAVKNIREIEVSVLGNDIPEASVAGEVIPSNDFYDYDAKYVDGKSTIVIPAELPKKRMKEIRQLALEAFKTLDCSGMARVDFFVTKKKQKIYLNEINTIPGFTSISMYPKLWEATGISYSQLLDRLIELALERHRGKMSLERVYAPGKEWYRGERNIT